VSTEQLPVTRWVYRPVLDIHQLGDVQSAVQDFLSFYAKCAQSGVENDHFTNRVAELRKLSEYLATVQGEFLAQEAAK